LLVGKGLLKAGVEGRTVKLWLTDTGHSTAQNLASSPDLEDLFTRAKLVAKTFGTMSGSALKDFVYNTFPEITTMRWGDPITI
jgi:hypothetical protein